MEIFLDNLYGLLITPPGNLIYHLVLTFSITAAFQALLVNNRNESNKRQRTVLVFIFILLLVSQLILLLGTALIWQGLWSSIPFLPPLDRAITTFSLGCIALVWIYPQPQKPHIYVSLFLTLIILLTFIYSLFTWNPAMAFNQTSLNMLWSIFILALLLAGIILLWSNKSSYWGLGIFVLGINLLCTLAFLFFPHSSDNFSGIIRIGHLCTFPLLPILSLRSQSRSATIPTTQPGNMDILRKKNEANKKIIASLTHELEAAQIQINKLTTEKEEARVKFQELSQDILFLSSQINFSDEQLQNGKQPLDSETESKGDQVLRVWIEQIQQDNEELGVENKQLQQKVLSLTAKIKQFQWDQKIDTDELDALQVENEALENLIDAIFQNSQEIETLINRFINTSLTEKKPDNDFEQYIFHIKEVIDSIQKYMDPLAVNYPLMPASLPESKKTEIPVNEDETAPVEAYEAELELLLDQHDKTPPSKTQNNFETEEQLGLPQFMENVSYREKTQPVRIKQNSLTTESTAKSEESDIPENRKQINGQLKRMGVQGYDHNMLDADEVRAYINPLFEKVHKLLSYLLALNQEFVEQPAPQSETALEINERVNALKDKISEVNQLIQENIDDITTAKQISSELKFKNEQLRNKIEKAQEAQLRAEEIADEQLNENSDLRTANEKFENETKKLKSKVDELTVDQQQAAEKIDEVERLRQQLFQENEELNFRLTKASSEKKEASLSINKLEADLSALDEKMESLLKETEHIKQENALNNRRISNLSKELAQPATSIQGYADLLLSETVGKLGAAHQKFAELIKTSSQKLSEALNELNELIGDEHGDETSTSQSIELNSMLKAAIDEVSSLSIAKGLNIQTSIRDEIKRVKLETDLLKQISIQLLENAIFRSPQNGEIEIRLEETENAILLRIFDQGSPYEEEQLNNLFEIQEEQQVNLSIAKTLTESLNGKIWAENQPDERTSISVQFPL